MSKYIDAEKLIAEIKEKITEMKKEPTPVDRETILLQMCRINAFREVLSVIFRIAKNSPKQEQPECIYGWALEDRKKSCKYCSALCEARFEKNQPEVDLKKFTEKIKKFQERYKHPEIVSIKGAMAFMARMFYQYPNAARLWYDNLPKITMD